MRIAAVVAGLISLAPAFPGAALPEHAPAAEAALRLRERYEELRPAFEKNSFGRPLHLASSDDGSRLRGDVHAVLDHPFDTLRRSLATPSAWCDILTLPFNVKGCEARADGGLTLYVGRKWDTPLADAVRIDFRFSAPSVAGDSLELRLEAPAGPLGTRDYRIAFTAVPLDGRRTLVHLGYGYTYGTVSKLAMQAYLATSGASKVGFTRESASGRWVGGMRGVLERNTMRYFLAVDAYLEALSAGDADGPRRRMDTWFRESERYPEQLHEMTREEYVAMKRRDLVPPRERLARGD